MSLIKRLGVGGTLGVTSHTCRRSAARSPDPLRELVTPPQRLTRSALPTLLVFLRLLFVLSEPLHPNRKSESVTALMNLSFQT